MPEVVLGPLYLMAILFPALFPKQADNLMDGNPIDYEPPTQIRPELVVATDVGYDNRDAKVLANIERVIANTTNPDVKRVWSVKKAEFERELRWKMERSITNGSERRAQHHG